MNFKESLDLFAKCRKDLLRSYIENPRNDIERTLNEIVLSAVLELLAEERLILEESFDCVWAGRLKKEKPLANDEEEEEGEFFLDQDVLEAILFAFQADFVAPIDNTTPQERLEDLFNRYYPEGEQDGEEE